MKPDTHTDSSFRSSILNQIVFQRMCCYVRRGLISWLLTLAPIMWPAVGELDTIYFSSFYVETTRP